MNFDNIRYYGESNLEKTLFIKEVCENIDSIKSIVTNLKKTINSLQDLCQFLWCVSFKKMSSEIDDHNVSDDLRQQIKELSNSFDLPIQEFVKYINNDYSSVFSEIYESKSIRIEAFSFTLDLCFGEYHKGINKEVFDYITENYALYILSDFNKYTSYYLANEGKFRKLFSGLKETRLFDDQIYLDFLMNVTDKSNSFLKDQASFICERTIKAIKNMNLNEDSKDIIQIQSLLHDYGELAFSFKLNCAYDYENLKKDVQQLANKFIEKHGIMRKIGPFNLEEAMSCLKKSDDQYRFLNLTHYAQNDGAIINSLDSIAEATNANKPLSELFDDISRSRSEKYPYYKQDFIKINLSIRAQLVCLVFSDKELVNDFANYLYNIPLQLQDCYFSKSINIEKEITGHVECILAMIDLYGQKRFEKPLGKALVYNTSLSICSTIEKILRNVAKKEEKKNAYYNFSKLSLSDFLGGKYKLTDVSKGLKYVLEYYLIKENNINEPSKPGLNIRNILAHGLDEAYEIANYEICITLFYLLISLLDDLFMSLK